MPLGTACRRSVGAGALALGADGVRRPADRREHPGVPPARVGRERRRRRLDARRRRQGLPAPDAGLRGDMRYVVFRPYWNVPPSIQRGRDRAEGGEEPRLHRRATTTSWSTTNGQPLGTHVDDACWRGCATGRVSACARSPAPQRPGPGEVHLPEREQRLLALARRRRSSSPAARRDFSHGCIRVEDPVALAEWVLRDTAGMDEGEDRGRDGRQGRTTRTST